MVKDEVTEAEKKGLSKAEREAKEKEFAEALEKATAENKSRSGIGTRVNIGWTRGQNSQLIRWEAFDKSVPETLPKTTDDFISVVSKFNPELTDADKSEPALVSYLIDGLNEQNYSAASDPIGAFVEKTWSDEVQKAFRLAVRNYSNATGLPIEDAANLMKPGIVKSQEKLAKTETPAPTTEGETVTQ